MSIHTAALERLLRYPHDAVFDTSPGAVLALSIPDNAWAVEGGELLVQRGEEWLVWPLFENTVGEIADNAAAAGITISALNPAISELGAHVLIQDRSGPGRTDVTAYTNPLWALMSAYAVSTGQAREDVVLALQQMRQDLARGEWLALWGDLMGVPAPAGMDDDAYAGHIPAEAFRHRLNPIAIEQAVFEQTGEVIRLHEPWRNVFRLSVSRLSDPEARTYDGVTVGYNLMRPVSDRLVNWDRVMPIIERNRAAGVLILPPEVALASPVIDARVTGHVVMARSDLFGDYGAFWTYNRLNYMRLSDEGRAPINHPALITQLSSIGAADPLKDPQTITSGRTTAKASIVLSDRPPLGDINAIFSRRMPKASKVPCTLSGELRLSDIDHKGRHVPVDEVVLDARGEGSLLFDTADSVGFARSELVGLIASDSLLGTLHVGIESAWSQYSLLDLAAVVSVNSVTLSGATWRDYDTWPDVPWSHPPSS